MALLGDSTADAARAFTADHGDDMTAEEWDEYYAERARMAIEAATQKLEQCQVVGPVRRGEVGPYSHDHDTRETEEDVA